MSEAEGKKGIDIQRILAPQETYKGQTLEEALAALQDAGFKDVTGEANKQNKRTDFLVYEDPGIGVHYCEFDYDVIELALDQELLDTRAEEKGK